MYAGTMAGAQKNKFSNLAFRSSISIHGRHCVRSSSEKAPR